MTTLDNGALTCIGQIAITAHDVDRATSFYRDVLRLQHLFRAGELSFFDCGGVRLMLARPEKAELDHPSSIIYFQVGDIGVAHKRIQKAGVRFEDEPHMVAKMPDHDLWMTFFRDSEDNLLALISQVPHAA